MNAFFALCVGLGLGLGICWLQAARYRRQLRRIFALLPPHLDEKSSFSLASRLRRAIRLAMADYTDLSQQVTRLQQLFEAAPFGYLEVDAADQLRRCNAYSRDLLKIDRWQADQARLLLELVRSYELDRLVAATRAAQQPQVLQWSYQTTTWEAAADSEPVAVAYSVAVQASSLLLADDAVGIFLIDQQQLADLQQSRDRTFSDLAHELRTPLTAIQLVAETLQSRLGEPEGQWVGQMLGETNRLMSLVQDYLEIERLQVSPAAALSLAPLSVDELVSETWQRLVPLAARKQLQLDYTASAPACQVKGDRRRLEQVFLNLFDNAIKHSPPQRAIQVRARCADANDGAPASPELRVDVIDAGTGFSDTELERVFERLYRSDTSRQRDPDLPASERARHGSGLGLAIAREIVQAHGGTLSARNHPETGGAWLQLRLPGVY